MRFSVRRDGEMRRRWSGAAVDRFVNQVLKFIRDNAMIEAGDAVTVGFSGGADSVCLLVVLNELKRLLGIELQAVHVNHNLRGAEALRDEAFCRHFAEELGIPFAAVSVSVRETAAGTGMTEEEAGRVLRYEALKKEAETFAAGCGEDAGTKRIRIAVAHHADDQAETILLNLLRGSGLKGLGGMRPVRDEIIRPLLGVSRSDITTFLEARSISFVDDSTNFENDHTRNRLRNIVMPELKEGINLRAAEHIGETGAFAREADAYLEAEAAAFLRQIGGPEPGDHVFSIKLGQLMLKEKPPIFRRYVIIEALKELGVPLKDWGEKHFSDIDKALFGSKGYHVDLPGGAWAENIYKETVVHRFTDQTAGDR